jgi:hypothetical protein
MKNCAYCGRENKDDAAQCGECGTPFVTEPRDSQTSNLDASDNPERAAADNRIIFRAVWCIGGILVTVFSYLSAARSPYGGTYIVAWGAILYGIWRVFQGLSGRNARSNSDDIGYEALAYGTKLETEGRVREALVVYQTIIEKYPETAASNDARKSIESLRGKLG